MTNSFEPTMYEVWFMRAPLLAWIIASSILWIFRRRSICWARWNLCALLLFGSLLLSIFGAALIRLAVNYELAMRNWEYGALLSEYIAARILTALISFGIAGVCFYYTFKWTMLAVHLYTPRLPTQNPA